MKLFCAATMMRYMSFPKNINSVYFKYFSPWRISHPVPISTNGPIAFKLQSFHLGHILGFDHVKSVSTKTQVLQKSESTILVFVVELKNM
jgi:hypothetical protein